MLEYTLRLEAVRYVQTPSNFIQEGQALSSCSFFSSVFDTSHFRLNVQNVNEMKEIFRPKHWRLTRRDLMRLTWTTKYKWERMERFHERKAKSIRAERERPYL